jgi:hypothetical protein
MIVSPLTERQNYRNAYEYIHRRTDGEMKKLSGRPDGVEGGQNRDYIVI